MIDESRWQAAATRHEAAVALLAAGRVAQAERLARGSLATLRRVVGDDHPDVGNVLDTLATIAARGGRAREARGLWRRALAALTADHPLVRQLRAAILINAGYADLMAGDPRAAATRVTEACALAAGLDDDARAAAWNLAGIVAKMSGRHDEAAAAYQRVVDQHRRRHQALPPTLLHNLAGLATARGDHARAADLLRRGLVVRRRARPRDDLGIATDLAGLGDALVGLGRPRPAIARYRAALVHYRRGGAPDHPEVAFCLHGLADALADAGADAEAETCYRQAIARKRAMYGRASAELAASLANLGVLLDRVGRGAEARRLWTRARRMSATLPADHPVRLGCAALPAPRAAEVSGRGPGRRR